MYLKRNRVKGILILLAAFLLLIGIMFFCLNQMVPDEAVENDMTEINRIVKSVEQNAQDLSGLSKETFPYPFNVTDEAGKVIYQTKGYADISREQAIRNNNTCYEYHSETKHGYVLIQTNPDKVISNMRVRVFLIFCVMLGVIFLLLMGLFFALEKNILKPFENMKTFANQVALGNLDLPLTLDKGNYFGAFTESFDIMREELKLSREREYKANVSKKELIASLSHDIKTPVTSIKLLSEVMLTKGQEPETQEKITAIYKKADQIDKLVSDMFHSTLEELGELKVNCADISSLDVAAVLKEADYNHRIALKNEIPECILYCDLLRLQQVMGNVIYNSYKYADTVIEVSYQLEGKFLQITIRDFGDGVSKEELPHLFQKFYRGEGAVQKSKDGAGLGLYICKSLMEKMEGYIDCEMMSDGFAVRIFVALSA